MARLDILNILYSKKKSINDFNWDAITAPPLLSLLSPYDIQMLDSICRDPRLNSSLSKKKEYIRQVLEPRGFVRFASGTNRVVYKFLEDQSFLIKVAISVPGLKDSPMEMRNQMYLKPFCAKCIEVSPMGTIGSFERVETINSVSQYLDVADDHFRLLNDKVFGKFIMADVGTKFWMNLGIRTGFGLVFVDYPLLYEVDGAKLFCNAKTITGLPCGGEIDYDAGCNFLYCTKCGKQYLASTLAKTGYSKDITIVKKGESKMKIEINYKGKRMESNEVSSMAAATTYLENVRMKPSEDEVGTGTLKVAPSDYRKRMDEKATEEKGAAKKESVEESVEIKPEEPTEAVSLSDAVADTAVDNALNEDKANIQESNGIVTEEPEFEIPKETTEFPEMKRTEPNLGPVPKEEVPQMKPELQPYQPKEKISGAFPASRNIMDNMEEEIIEESNPKGYPKKKKKGKKNKNYSHY